MIQKRITIRENEPLIRMETGEDGKAYFVGYAAVYNSRSHIIVERGRRFTEILMPGCFNRVLQDPKLDVVLTLNHDKYLNLGRTVSGNLQLQSDDVGLRFKAPVPNTTLGRDTQEMIQRGDYTDCSFSFDIEDAGERWEQEKGKGLLHRIIEVSGLGDVAICTLHGAYGDTVVDVERANRMLDEMEKEEEKEKNKPETERKIRIQEYMKTVTNSLKG